MTGNVCCAIRYLLCAAAYAAIAAAWTGLYEFKQEIERWSRVDVSTHQMRFVPIAFLIVFWANVAHDRFWEGALHVVCDSEHRLAVWTAVHPYR